MNSPNRRVWLAGVAGLVIGVLLDSLLSVVRFGGARLLPGLGMPEVMVITSILVYLGFWLLLIVLVIQAIRWLGGSRRDRRLDDLPADFDDWHRRAHAQMAREAAAHGGEPDRRS